MSMWEIEALIEDSIRLIDQSDKTIRDKQNLIWNLYQTQAMFDCSFTNFRLMEVLLKNEYTKTLAIQQYPNYSKHEAYFKRLQEKSFDYLNERLGEPADASNGVTAYWDKPSKLIYYDFGSPLWNQLQERRPTLISSYDLALLIIKEADNKKQSSSVYDWTAFLINYGFAYQLSDAPLENLKEQYFVPIKAIYRKYNFTDYEPMHDSLTITKEAVEWFGKEENEFIKWFNS